MAQTQYDYFTELGIDCNVDKEWGIAYIHEQAILFGEFPSAKDIERAWEHNKEYFQTRKGKPFLELTHSENN